ncbi:MAG: hypothetical protein ABSC60_11930 [Acidobacteriota bacterium]
MKATVLFTLLAVSIIGLTMAGTPPAGVDQLLGQYFSIHKSLASDSINGVAASAAGIARISRQAAATETQGKTQLIALSEVAAKFNAADLKSARNWFGDLSDKLIAYIKASGAKTNPPYQFFCSMVKKNWLQPDKATRNPYLGSEMPKCGELIQWQKANEPTMEQPMDQSMGRHH